MTIKLYTKLKLGVYVYVNWKFNFIFERFYAYSEVIIKKFSLLTAFLIPIFGLEILKKNNSLS